MIDRETKVLRALRRNGLGARVLVALLQQGSATASDLAVAASSYAYRVHWAIEGHHPEYRRSQALLTLGLLHRRRIGNDTEYALTLEGRRWAERVQQGLLPDELVVRTLRQRGPST
jgi:predicted transcriptional regulator with HTH domain